MVQLAGIFAVVVASVLPAPPLAAPSAGEPVAPSSCAIVQSIDSWKDVDESNVIVETSPRRRYKVEFSAPCPDAKRAMMALIQRAPSAGMCLSPGDAIIFARRSPAGPQNFDYDESCVIKTITAQPIEASTP